MPDYVSMALDADGLMEFYNDRPWYQQNDYVGWIVRAKLEAARRKRLQQMLAELRAIARQLNERPRRTLQYQPPAEKFAQCVTSIS